MPTGLELKSVTPAEAKTPDTGKGTLFFNSEDADKPYYKDAAGAEHPLEGDVGDPGEGVPTGGTAGQYLRKASGTDFDTAFASIAQSEVTNLTTDLAAKAPLASPTFTGTPAAPTAAGGTNTTQIATTAFVTAAVAAGGSYTDEMAQDAVGAMIADTATIDLTYTDATPELKADVKDDSVTYAKMQNVSAASKLIGRGDSGSGDPQEITLGTGLTMTGTTLSASGGGGSGVVVQVKNVQTGAVATGTTIIPFDDTIPQNTEGTEFMTLSITPTSATNKLKIEVVFFGTNANINRWLSVALFQDSTAGALAAIANFQTVATAANASVFTHYMTAGTTSATTFKVRAGPNTADTTTFNGQSGGRIFGGVMASSITITEIVP